MTKASGVYGSDGTLKLVVNVIEDITEVKRAELAQRMLARAGELLSSSLDYERTLQQVAELAVPQLADWCTVSMPDPHGFVRAVAVAHVDPEKVAFARRIGERYPTRADAPTGAAQILRDGRSQLVNDIPPEMLAAAAQDEEHLELITAVGLQAGLAVPMTAGGRIIGVLSLVSAESGRRFTDADVTLAEELARRAGTAVENARLYTERSNIARTLQTSLLPRSLPPMPGWTAATLYRPAGDENWVGGDFYDAIAVDGGWLAIVGDVAGRGAPAAALTGLARHTLRTAATLLDEPLDAVRTLNDELLARGGHVAVLRRGGAAVRWRGGIGDGEARLRRAPAAAARARRGGAADRRVLADARRLSARRMGAARRSTSSPATWSCSSPTACSTPSARTGASARSGSRARWRARPTPRMPSPASTPR